MQVTVCAEPPARNFNYGNLSTESIKQAEDSYREIQTALKGLQASMMDVQNHIIHMGKQLLRIKKIMDLGMFTSWIDQNIGFSLRTAERYMNVAENLADRIEKRQAVVFDKMVLYELSNKKTPNEVIEKAIETAESGMLVTVSQIKRWKAEQNPKKGNQSDGKNIETDEEQVESNSDTSATNSKVPEPPDTSDSINTKQEQLYQTTLGTIIKSEDVLSTEFSSKLREFLEFTLDHADLLDGDNSKQKLNHCMDEFNRRVNDINLRLGDFNETLDKVEEYETTSKDETSELVA